MEFKIIQSEQGIYNTWSFIIGSFNSVSKKSFSTNLFWKGKLQYSYEKFEDTSGMVEFKTTHTQKSISLFRIQLYINLINVNTT